MGAVRDGSTWLWGQIPSPGRGAVPWQCWDCHEVLILCISSMQAVIFVSWAYGRIYSNSYERHTSVDAVRSFSWPVLLAQFSWELNCCIGSICPSAHQHTSASPVYHESRKPASRESAREYAGP